MHTFVPAVNYAIALFAFGNTMRKVRTAQGNTPVNGRSRLWREDSATENNRHGNHRGKGENVR